MYVYIAISFYPLAFPPPPKITCSVDPLIAIWEVLANVRIISPGGLIGPLLRSSRGR